MTNYVSLASDYQESCHPAILERLLATNLSKRPGYGTDEVCESARARIRQACAAPDASVHFLSGGTQTNALVIDALLALWEGVVAATTGHVSAHEAGAIEHGGHKVLEIPGEQGKLTAAQVQACAAAWEQDDNREHMVQPGVVYLSQPTEMGTLYSREELEAIGAACRSHGLRLYVDGARLAYALGSPANDVTLADLARECDAFYIGGTKCGALLGEAVVFPDPSTFPRFFTFTKQHGALLAKGWVLGMQFDVLFEDDRYLALGKAAVDAARRLSALLLEAGYELAFDAPTNQVFVVLDNAQLARWEGRIGYSFWEKPDADHTLVRLATSWATTAEDLEAFARLL